MKYNTREMKKTRARAILLCALAVLTIIHGVIVLERADARTGWEPDVVYPMTNAHISWEQTFYGGAEK